MHARDSSFSVSAVVARFEYNIGKKVILFCLELAGSKFAGQRSLGGVHLQSGVAMRRSAALVQPKPSMGPERPTCCLSLLLQWGPDSSQYSVQR